MVIGQDVTAAAHDHAAAKPRLRITGILITKEKAKPRVVHLRVFDSRFAGVNAHHSRRSYFCRGCKTAHRAV